MMNGALSVEMQVNKLFTTYKEGIISEQGVESLAELAVAQLLATTDTSKLSADALNKMISDAIDAQTLL